MSIESVLEYHQRTKHQLNAYAKGPASLDWDDQPSPFRRFSGCEQVSLAPPGRSLDVSFAELDQPQNTPIQALTFENLALMLELAFGLSAWKQYGPDRWSLRCNPSSGNLHPTEAYIICGDEAVLPPGVYHYLSHDHVLQKRCLFSESPAAEILIGLSSVHWREAWKYGERAFRYCQHDTGHALGALAYAAACLGWRLELISEIADRDITVLLGLDQSDQFVQDEREYPDLLCRLHPQQEIATEFDLERWIKPCKQDAWHGKALALHGRHLYRWPVIDEAASLTTKPATPPERWQLENKCLPKPLSTDKASTLIRQRRSAQQFNAKSRPLAMASFQRMMLAVQVSNKPPFQAWNWPPLVQLLVFVHRVEGLEPGLYVLPRGLDAKAELQPLMSQEFSWRSVGMPFEFYELLAGSVRQAAKTLSCHQSIASDCAFSLGMLAPFSEDLEHTPWMYKRLFWECGLIGQILYLEAEAAGYRATGIGCFFDDAVHGVLGLQDSRWQSLYHFTVGEPLEDSRLVSLPAYEHLHRQWIGST